MSVPVLTAFEFYKESSVNQFKIGQLAVSTNGDRFRYVKNGLAALVAGNLLQEPVEDTQFVSMAVPAAVAIGATSITVTNGTTTVTANMFDNGRLTVSTSTGIGQSFHIVSHSTGASGAAITYIVDRPLLVALSTSSKVSTRVNPYNGVIQYPVTTQTGGADGFALIANTISYYGWIQSGGDTAVLFDTGTNTSNGITALQPSQAVAGAVEITEDAAGAQVIGYARQVVSVDSTVAIAHISID